MLTALFLNKIKNFLGSHEKGVYFDSISSVSIEKSFVLITTRKPIVNSWLSSRTVEIQALFVEACKDIGMQVPTPDILFR